MQNNPSHDRDPMPEWEAPVNLNPDRNGVISIRLLWACAVALIAGTVSIVSFGFRWSNRMDEMSRQLTALERIQRTAWTVADEREYAHRMQRENANLKLPDPSEVHRTIHEER